MRQVRCTWSIIEERYIVSPNKLSIVALIVTLCLVGCDLSDSTPVSPTDSPSTPYETATSTLAPIETPTASLTPFLVGPSDTPIPTLEPTSEIAVVFAVIGDYGSGNRTEGVVADLVHTWQPDFIITTGDNNYPDGSEDTIDATIGQFYHDFIYPYAGSFGEGADQNRFFPSLGNHDWITDYASPYLDYFTLPGN